MPMLAFADSGGIVPPAAGVAGTPAAPWAWPPRAATAAPGCAMFNTLRQDSGQGAGG